MSSGCKELGLDVIKYCFKLERLTTRNKKIEKCYILNV